MRIDVDGLERVVIPQLKTTKSHVESARSVLSTISAPSDFPGIGNLSRVKSELGSVCQGINGYSNYTKSVIDRFSGAERRNMALSSDLATNLSIPSFSSKEELMAYLQENPQSAFELMRYFVNMVQDNLNIDFVSAAKKAVSDIRLAVNEAINRPMNAVIALMERNRQRIEALPGVEQTRLEDGTLIKVEQNGAEIKVDGNITYVFYNGERIARITKEGEIKYYVDEDRTRLTGGGGGKYGEETNVHMHTTNKAVYIDGKRLFSLSKTYCDAGKGQKIVANIEEFEVNKEEYGYDLYLGGYYVGSFDTKGNVLPVENSVLTSELRYVPVGEGIYREENVLYFDGIQVGSFVLDENYENSEWWEIAGATTLNAVTALEQGIYNFGEGIVDLTVGVGSVVATPFTLGYDFYQWAKGKITGNDDWSSATKAMWTTSTNFIATEHVNDFFDYYHENNDMGKWCDKHAISLLKSDGLIYNGIEVAGEIAAAVYTGDLISLAGYATKGADAVAKASKIITPLLRGASVTGNEIGRRLNRDRAEHTAVLDSMKRNGEISETEYQQMKNDWVTFSNVFNAYGYGIGIGMWEAAQMHVGMANKLATTTGGNPVFRIPGITNNRLSNVILDTGFNTFDTLFRSFSDAVTSERTFAQSWQENGGWRSTALQFGLGLAMSGGGEVLDIISQKAKVTKIRSELIKQGFSETEVDNILRANGLISGNASGALDSSNALRKIETVNGNIGCDQGGFRNLMENNPAEYARMKKIIMDKYNFSAVDVDKMMNLVDEVGACNYARSVNSIIEEFSDKPEVFKEIFGFDLYREVNGKYVINDLELFADYYFWGNKFGDGHQIIEEINGKNVITSDAGWKHPDTGNRIVPQRGGAYWELDQYLQYKLVQSGANIDISLDSKALDLSGLNSNQINKRINQLLENGENLSIGGRGYILRSLDGTINQEIDGGHWVKIIGTTDSGEILVSSWGKECIIDLDIPSAYFDVIQDVYNFGQVSPNYSKTVIDSYMNNIQEFSSKGISLQDYMSDNGITVRTMETRKDVIEAFGDGKLYILDEIQSLSSGGTLSPKKQAQLDQLILSYRNTQMSKMDFDKMMKDFGGFLSSDQKKIAKALMENNSNINLSANQYAAVNNYTNMGGFEINGYLNDITMNGTMVRNQYSSIDEIQDIISGRTARGNQYRVNSVFPSSDGSIIEALDSVISETSYGDAIVTYRGVKDLWDGNTMIDPLDLQIGDSFSSAGYQSTSALLETSYAVKDGYDIVLQAIIPPNSSAGAYIEDISGVLGYGQMEVLLGRNTTMTVIGDIEYIDINGTTKILIPVLVE